MPKVWNKRQNGIPVDAVYVGRPTQYGNPFIVGQHGVQGECCDLYEEWIRNQPELIAKIKRELKGKDLVCWCHPRRCHADTIMRIANEEEPVEKYLPYAGIGARETPPEMLHLMQGIGAVLTTKGFTLRSGGADGADTAFEQGCDAAGGKKEIFLPWKGFNGNSSPLYAEPTYQHMVIAEAYHPAWDRCSPGAQKMHARNVSQLLGSTLNQPSQFVVCWTKGGMGGGGTGQALRIAEALGVPIFDLGKPDPHAELTKLDALLNTLTQGA